MLIQRRDVVPDSGCAAMINITAVLIANGIGIMLLLSMLYNIKTRRGFNSVIDRLFGIMLLFNFLQCVLEPVTFLVDGGAFPLCHEVLMLSNSLLYINTAVFSFLWTVYAEYKLFGDRYRIHRIYRLMAIPCAAVIVSVIVNLFTPVFFTVSADNIYDRTELYFIPYAITYFYLLFGMANVFKNRKKTGKYLFLPVLIFLIPVFIGSTLQVVFYGISLIWVGVAVGLTSLYTNVQNEISTTDPLSGLYTRQHMSLYLSSAVNQLSGTWRIAGIMLDIDRFKSINDSFGHLTGDDAIKSAGELLHKVIPENGIAARYAGDEFIIVIKIQSEDEITALIRRIESETERFNASNQKQYRLEFSIGYSVYGKDDTADEFLGRMDKEMYKEKRRKFGDRRKSELLD